MRIHRILLTPWISTPPGLTRWFVGVSLILDMLAAGVTAGLGQAMTGVVVMLAGIAFMWVFVLPSMLWLTQAANRLHLPAIRGDVNRSLGLYAVASVGLPLLLAAVFGGQLATTVLLAGLTLSAAFLYAILPWVLGVFVWVVPVLFSRVLNALHFGDPGFAGRALPVVTMLALLVAWRWWRLQRRSDLLAHPMRRPLALGFHRVAVNVMTHGSSSNLGSQPDYGQLLRRRPDWLQPRADLRRTGPAFPQRALRVALGGNYLPQMWTRLWRQWLLGIGILLVFAAFWAWLIPHAFGSLANLASGGLIPIAIDFIAAVAAAVTPIVFVQYLDAQWGKTNAELPLLALLPGLGPAVVLKHTLMHTMLSKPLAILLGLWLVMACTSAFVHVGWITLLLLLATPIFSATWLATSIICLLGGRLPRGVRFVLDWVGMTALLILSCLSAGLAPSVPASAPWLMLAWLLWLVLVAAIGCSAWRVFRKCPHAFVLHTH